MEAVNHPEHYGGDTPYEVIKVLEAWDLLLAYGFCWGNAIKYTERAGKKDPRKATEDLEKAEWYTNRAKTIRVRLDARKGIDGETEAQARHQHLLDVYRAFGVEWGEDPFAAIKRLRADTDWEEVEDLVAMLHAVRSVIGENNPDRSRVGRVIEILETIYHPDQ